MSPPTRVAISLDGAPAPTPAVASSLPRRVLVPAAALEALALRTGTRWPWRDDPAPARLDLALGDRGRAPAEPPDEGALATRGLLTATGAPVAEVADALAVFAAAEVAVRLDLGVRRPAAPRGVARFSAWHHPSGGRVTAVSMTGGPELELAWYADSHWPRELAHLVTVPALAAASPADGLTLPFELLLGAGAALRQQRPAVLAELLARHRVLGPGGATLGTDEAGEQLRLLHTAERGRLQVTVAGVGDACRRLVGVVAWVLFADGWRALVPTNVDRLPMVRLVAVEPARLAVEVAALVTGARKTP